MPSPKARQLSHPMRLGNVVIDPHDRAIRRGDGAPPARLEPRVFEVLRCLLERPGEVVTRGELIDRVWPRMAVTDEVLSRGISQLRKHLGDDRRNPRFIETVPKTGYRLLLTPEPLAPPGPPSRAPTLPRFLAAAAVLGIVAFALTLTDGGSDATSGQPARVGVFPIDPGADGTSAELLALSLVDLIAARLNELPGIETRSSAFMGDALAALGSTGRVLADAGLRYGVTGALAPSSDPARAVLQLELLEHRRGRGAANIPIGTFEVPYLDSQRDLESLLAVREAVAAKLAAAASTHLPEMHRRDGLNFEGYRLMLLAQAELDAGADCGLGAEAMLLRALEHDPASARTYSILGDAYWMQVWDCGRGIETAERAIAAFDRALELDPGELSAAYMKASLLAEMGRAEEGLDLIVRLSKEYPRRIEIQYARMFVLRYAGLLDEATEAMERVLAHDPLALATEMLEMPNNLLYQRHWRRYLDTAPALRIPMMSYYRAYAHWRLGETDRALELLDKVAAMNAGGVFVDYSLALRAHLNGDDALAVGILHGLIEKRRAFESIDGEMPFKEAQLLAIAGDVEASLDRARHALELGFFCVACYAEEPSFAALATHPEMRSIVAAARLRQEAFRERMQAL